MKSPLHILLGIFIALGMIACSGSTGSETGPENLSGGVGSGGSHAQPTNPDSNVAVEPIPIDDEGTMHDFKAPPPPPDDPEDHGGPQNWKAP